MDIFPLTPHPESFNFVEIAIIRSPLWMSFHRVAITCFECNVLSCGLGGEKIITIILIHLEFSLQFSFPVLYPVSLKIAAE